MDNRSVLIPTTSICCFGGPAPSGFRENCARYISAMITMTITSPRILPDVLIAFLRLFRNHDRSILSPKGLGHQQMFGSYLLWPRPTRRLPGPALGAVLRLAAVPLRRCGDQLHTNLRSRFRPD